VSRKPRVVITESAKLDVRSVRDYIARDRAKAAAEWVREFQRRARLLASMPLGFEIIPEAEQIGAPFRHVVFGNYRIIYQVVGNQVILCRVIHAARLFTLRMMELPPAPDE
jgi:plasmid stabilization system protein ParE